MCVCFRGMAECRSSGEVVDAESPASGMGVRAGGSPRRGGRESGLTPGSRRGRCSGAQGAGVAGGGRSAQGEPAPGTRWRRRLAGVARGLRRPAEGARGAGPSGQGGAAARGLRAARGGAPSPRAAGLPAPRTSPSRASAPSPARSFPPSLPRRQSRLPLGLS